MCGGNGGILGGLLGAIFGKAKEPDLPTIEPTPVPDVPTNPAADEETKTAVAAARKKQIAALRRTQAVKTSEEGLGDTAAPTLKKLLGGS